MQTGTTNQYMDDPSSRHFGWILAEDEEEDPIPRQRSKGNEDDGSPDDSRDDRMVHVTSFAVPTQTPLRPLPFAAPGLYLLPNSANGNCQFWALAQALNLYVGRNLDALQDRLDMFKLRLGRITGAGAAGGAEACRQAVRDEPSAQEGCAVISRRF